MKFSIGDLVRPRPSWARPAPVAQGGGAYPAGRVIQVKSFGLGQIIKLDSHPKWWLSNCYENQTTTN